MAGPENLPVFMFEDPYFDKNGRQHKKSGSVDRKEYLRKRSSMTRLDNTKEEQGRGKESGKAEGQPSDKTGIPPKSSISQLTHISKKFLESQAHRGDSKIKKIVRLARKTFGYKASQESSVAGQSQQSHPEAQQRQRGNPPPFPRTSNSKDKRGMFQIRQVGPPAQPLRPYSEQQITQALRLVDMQIEQLKNQRKENKDKLDYTYEKLEKAERKFEQSQQFYHRAVRQKDPDVEVWKEAKYENLNECTKLSQRITILEGKQNELYKQISSKQTKRQKLKQEQRRYQPETKPQRYIGETQSKIEIQREFTKDIHKKVEISYEIPPENTFMTNMQKKPENSSTSYERRAEMTQEELREAKLHQMQIKGQGLGKQKAELEKQISDLEVKMGKTDAKEAAGTEKKGLEDLMDEKKLKLKELQQMIEEHEAKLQAI